MMVSFAHSGVMNEAEAAKTGGAGFGHASGSMGAHDCCKARHATERRVFPPAAHRTLSSESFANLERLAEVPDSSNAISCCPLTSGSIVVAARQRVSEDKASVSSVVNVTSSVVGFTTTPVVRLPNQKQTYLRGCVFLI
jgi:hypothetical protein